ncbi:hypothetical protein DXG01_016136 [Tephrocybe rancida]|nr:hypothetical protein DXG01_016136 [Tephrocybe rancida]
MDSDDELHVYCYSRPASPDTHEVQRAFQDNYQWVHLTVHIQTLAPAPHRPILVWARASALDITHTLPTVCEGRGLSPEASTTSHSTIMDGIPLPLPSTKPQMRTILTSADNPLHMLNDNAGAGNTNIEDDPLLEEGIGEDDGDDDESGEGFASKVPLRPLPTWLA